MEFTSLAAFVAVAEEGSFVGAAGRVHLGQPAVSQHVQRLERSLGVRLFDRTSRRVELTAAGREVLVEARAVLGATERVRAAAARFATTSTLRLGTATGLGARLGATLAEVVRLAPATRVELVSLRLPARLEAVRSGGLDAAFVPAATAAAGLEVLEVWEEPLIAALPGSHPLADGDEVELTDLRELPARLAERLANPPFVDLMTSLLDDGRQAARGSRFTRLQDVLAGLAAGRAEWTPLYGELPDAPDVAFRPVAGQRITIGLAVPAGPPGPALRTLLAAVDAVVARPDR